jgi:hypothetical protein
MTSTFPMYFIKSSLNACGWPRKQSFLGRTGIPGQVLHYIVQEMAKASIGIGAGRPLIAAQLLTQLFSRRDWETQSAEDFFADLVPCAISAIEFGEEMSPWAALVHEEVESYDKIFVSEKLLMKAEIPNLWSRHCSLGLIWGLIYADEAKAALDSDRLKYKSGAEVFARAGVEAPQISEWADNESHFQWLEQVVSIYQTECGPLPKPAPELLNSLVVRSRIR